MGQFKKGKQDTIVIGEGHSLMLGHMPNSIPSDAYSELNFGLNKSGIESYGLWSNSINYNTFYPGVTQEEFMPKDTDFIEPVYRLLSEVIVNKEWNPVDFSRNGALKASLKMLVGQTVNCDHSTDVANAIGSVKQTFWQESFKQDGIVIRRLGLIRIAVDLKPAGIFHEPDRQHMGGALRREAQTQGRMELANPRGDDMHRGAMFGEPAMGAQDLNLLNAVGAADRDSFPFEEIGVGGRVEQKTIELPVEIAIRRREEFRRDRRHRRRRHQLLHAQESGGLDWIAHSSCSDID